MATKRKKAEIYLVPGFLGFASLGRLGYYLGVPAMLEEKLAALGVEAKVYPTETLPAGSLHKRARKLAEEIAARHEGDATSVHLVGHSTGGLDIRLLLTPGGALDADGADLASMDPGRAETYRAALRKVRSAVGVATPHYGAPIADIAVRVSLDEVLRRVGPVAEHGAGRALITALLEAAGGAARVLGALPGNWSFLDWIAADVLWERPDDVLRYLADVGEDVGALRNLTQESTDLANALLRDRRGVAYGSVITGTRAPRGRIATTDPLLYVNTLLFRAAWLVGARHDPAYPYPPRLDELARGMAADRAAGLDVGELPIDARVNDGVVPTASQAYGTVLGVFASDHLDCVGHFPRVLPDGTSVSGWVRSGAGFGDARFELLWGRVARFVAASAGAKVSWEGSAWPRPGATV